MNRAGRAFLLCLLGCGILPRPAVAQEDRTPRAGEEFMGTLFGKPVNVPARDRTRVMELWVAAQWIPDGPETRTFVPEGAAFL